MEAYRGLVIFTTNLKSSLDAAFLRRMRFIVQFPYSDAIKRLQKSKADEKSQTSIKMATNPKKKYKL